MEWGLFELLKIIPLGIVPTSECPNCRAFDSPMHMLTEFVLARQVWQQLKAKIPIRPGYTLMQYAIGIND